MAIKPETTFQIDTPITLEQFTMLCWSMWRMDYDNEGQSLSGFLAYLTAGFIYDTEVPYYDRDDKVYMLINGYEGIEGDFTGCLPSRLLGRFEDASHTTPSLPGSQAEWVNSFIAYAFDHFIEWDQFEVIVGNVGQIYFGESYKDAMTCFNECVELSKLPHGRASGEQVILFQKTNGRYTPIEEYLP